MIARIKTVVKNFITSIQKLIVVVSLFLIYIFGFGLTVIFMLIAKRGFLKDGPAQKDTFWKEADGYDAGIDEAFRQS